MCNAKAFTGCPTKPKRIRKGLYISQMAGRSVLPFYLNFQTLNLSLPNNCTNTVCLQEHAGVPDVVWTKAETWAENEPRSNLVFSTQSVLMGKRAGGFYLPLTVSALSHVHKLQLWGWNIWLQIKSEWMIAKMASWTLHSIWLHSLERRLGLWTGKESKEHELKGLARGIGWCHSSN